jgi:hypothetical protein
VTDNASAGATPVVAGATPAQTPPPTDASPAAPAPPATGEPDVLGDPGKRALDAMKAERDAATRAAKAAEKELQTLREAALSETEKRDKRLAELEGKEADWQREKQDLVLHSSVERAAAKIGFVDVSDAYGLLDRTAITFEDDGSPKNIDKLLTDLAKAKPYLVGRGRPLGSADAGVIGNPPHEFLASQLNDRAFYQANQVAIMAAMRDGRIVDDNPK